MNSCYFAAFPRRVEKAAKKRTDTLGKLHLPLVSNTSLPADRRQWVTTCHFLGRTQKFCATMSQPEQTILVFFPLNIINVPAPVHSSMTVLRHMLFPKDC